MDAGRTTLSEDARGDHRPAPDAAVTLFVCLTCAAGAPSAAGGAALYAAARAGAADSGLRVAGVKCLAGCKRGLAAALSRHDGWTYVFGDLSPDAAGDLIAGARLLAAAPDGLLPWRGRPEPLKRGLIARVPPLSFIEDTP